MKRRHDDVRDVYVDGKVYRKSSTWQRRLRRQARRHYRTLCDHHTFSPAKYVLEAKAAWAILARNG